MRSFKWQALFAAAVFAVPTFALAQSEDNQNQNENQNEPVYAPLGLKPVVVGVEDPFYAAGDPKPRVNVQVAVKPQITGRKTIKTQYTAKPTRSSGGAVGLAISSVPPAMAAQLRLEPGVGVVVEQVASGSAIEAAGIEQYDVIERVDHRPIHQAQDLTQALRNAKSDSISLDIVRQAHHQSVNVDRQQLRQTRAFSFSGAQGGGGGEFGGGGGGGFVGVGGGAGGGMNFQTDPRAKAGQDQADYGRDNADRQREMADRARDRELERAQRDRDRASAMRDRENAKRDQQNSERQQIDAIRDQIKSQLDRQRAELDRAREQLNRATQEMNQRLSELRVKLDTELRQKLESEFQKGKDQIREKMQLLEEQGSELQPK